MAYTFTVPSETLGGEAATAEFTITRRGGRVVVFTESRPLVVEALAVELLRVVEEGDRWRRWGEQAVAAIQEASGSLSREMRARIDDAEKLVRTRGATILALEEENARLRRVLSACAAELERGLHLSPPSACTPPPDSHQEPPR